MKTKIFFFCISICAFVSCIKNETDAVITDPKYMTIKSVVVKNIPLTYNGASWDAETNNSGADVIISLQNGTNPYQKSSTFQDNSATSLSYSVNLAIKLSRVDEVVIVLYDNDNVANSDEYMASTDYFFWYTGLKSKSYPKTIILEGDNGISAELTVEYSNN